MARHRLVGNRVRFPKVRKLLGEGHAFYRAAKAETDYGKKAEFWKHFSRNAGQQ
jgi:hypothetical protein